MGNPENRIYTIPNFLALYRILAAPAAFFLIINNIYPASFILVLSAFFSDLIDGLIARKFNQRSNLGMVLDPIADKLLFAFVLFGILIKSHLYELLRFYSLFAVFYVVVYALIHPLFVTQKISIAKIGKVCVFANSIILLIFVYGVVEQWVLFVFTIFLMIPPIVYVFKIVKIIK